MHDGLVPVLDDLKKSLRSAAGTTSKRVTPPTTLPERQDEILKASTVVSLKPAARGAGAENTFLSGKAGQGKTAAAKAELAELEAFADAQDLDLTTVFFSCEESPRATRSRVGSVRTPVARTPMGHPMQKVSTTSGTR